MGSLSTIALATVAASFRAAGDLVLTGVYSRPSTGDLAAAVEFVPQPLAAGDLANGYLHPGDVRLLVKASTLGGHAFKMDGGDTLMVTLSGGGTLTYLVIGGAIDATGSLWTVYGRAS